MNALSFGRSIENALGKSAYRALTAAARQIARARAESAVIDGVFMPYFVRPSAEAGAPPVVLIHGFGGDKEGWLVMASFLHRTRGFVIPDLPGFGAAGHIPKERASARQQARAIAELLNRLNVPGAHLVGNSMGGGVALRFAQDFPERALSLTLIGSVGPMVEEKSEVGLAFDRGENLLITKSPEDIERLFALVAERLPPTPRAVRRYLGRERFARQEAHAELFEGWISPPEGDGIDTNLSRHRMPVLVIHGDKDRVIHPATGRALAAQLPDARLERLAGIGHVPHIEAPKKTAELLEAFLADAARPR